MDCITVTDIHNSKCATFLRYAILNSLLKMIYYNPQTFIRLDLIILEIDCFNFGESRTAIKPIGNK